MQYFQKLIINICLLITIIFCFTSIDIKAFTLPAGSKHKFIGVVKCKMCHKKEKKGLQWEIWKESAHSKAYDVLATAKAKELAEKNGIADPQKDSKCLKCHTTGHDAPPELKGRKFNISEGVGCESCHGAGGDYFKSKVMKGLRNGSINPKSVGLIIPVEANCTVCHNSDDIMPIEEEFNYKKMWAKIAHPIPEG